MDRAPLTFRACRGGLVFAVALLSACGGTQPSRPRGQHVFVLPALRLVVVVTARDSRVDTGRQILDAVVATVQPLSVNR